NHVHCSAWPPLVRPYGRKAGSRKSNTPSTPEADDLVVREFEQVGPDPKKDIVQVNRKNDAKAAEAEVHAEVEELDRELKMLNEGPFGPNSKFMQALPPEDRERALKALAEEGLLDDTELEGLVDN